MHTLLSSGRQVDIEDSPPLGDHLFSTPLLHGGEAVVYMLLAAFWSLRIHRQVALRPRRQTLGLTGWAGIPA